MGLTPLVVAIDELEGLASAQAKEKAELIALLTQIALKGRSSGVILVVASQFASVDTIPNAVRSQLSRVLLGSAPAELVRWFPDWPWNRSARQFEAVYVDGQLGKEPGRYQVPSFSEDWKMFLNRGSFVVALDRRTLCEPFIAGPAGGLLTASRKAERLSGVGLP